MTEISEVELETDEYVDWRDVTWDELGNRGETFRRVWKPGTRGYNEAQISKAIAVEVAAIGAEINVLTAEAARLRDPAVAFTTQQLRNDLARLADDVARLARDVIRLGQLALRDFNQPGS